MTVPIELLARHGFAYNRHLSELGMIVNLHLSNYFSVQSSTSWNIW